jgi:hypothetical protein
MPKKREKNEAQIFLPTHPFICFLAGLQLSGNRIAFQDPNTHQFAHTGRSGTAEYLHSACSFHLRSTFHPGLGRPFTFRKKSCGCLS